MVTMLRALAVAGALFVAKASAAPVTADEAVAERRITLADALSAADHLPELLAAQAAERVAVGGV